jgi:Holliday junction resolvasome RuvABC DNA-binding subunit
MQANYVGKIAKKSAQNLIIKLRNQLIEYAKSSSSTNKTVVQHIYRDDWILSRLTMQV